LHLPVEPDGRGEEVVVVLGDGLPIIVEEPELVVSGCGVDDEEIELEAGAGVVLGVFFRT
jgi:hypothetical protein